jgi:hypothetical protein
MIDQEFLEEDDDLGLPTGDFKEDEPKDNAPPAAEGIDVEIELVDDTPEKDRGRPTADNLSDDDTETEAEKYSKRVKARIDKETAKTHAERRAKEERERQLDEAAQLARRLIQENNHLKGLIENGEKVLVTEHQGRLDGQLATAKAAYREAHEAGDVNGMLAAQETIARVASQMERLTTHQAQPLPRMDETRELQRLAPQQRQNEPEPDAKAWQEKNKWFGRDEIMTSFAMGLHSHLVNREGILPTDGQAYYERIDSEMRKRFPERFTQAQGTAPRRTETVVAPANRSGGGRVTRKVTLTESQAKLARRLGLTLEQYAEQLAAEGGTSKEYVHGKS